MTTTDEKKAEEIENTPEMIEAASKCLWGFEYQVDSAEEMAREIFLEICGARRQVQSQVHSQRLLPALSSQ